MVEEDEDELELELDDTEEERWWENGLRREFRDSCLSCSRWSEVSWCWNWCCALEFCESVDGAVDSEGRKGIETPRVAVRLVVDL